jgi:hypothetical protein
MGSEIKVPGDLEKTFAEDEKASIVVEPSKLKPKMHPKKLIVTNKRAIIYKAKLMGHEVQDIPLESITNIEIKKGMTTSEIKIHIGSDDVEIEDIPNDDAERAVSILKTNLENQKKASKGVPSPQTSEPTVSSTASSSPVSQGDPVQRLKQFKDMLDAGLISQEEYDSKKADIMSKM